MKIERERDIYSLDLTYYKSGTVKLESGPSYIKPLSFVNSHPIMQEDTMLEDHTI